MEWDTEDVIFTAPGPHNWRLILATPMNLCNRKLFTKIFRLGIPQDTTPSRTPPSISFMRRFCPSISDLQAFEVAARQGSFTRAAQELCVTQGAVSKQIKSLETFLGVTLFRRTRAGLVLTQAGHAYLNDIRFALNRIEAASLAIMSHQGRGGVLRINCMPTIGAKWLIPRLPALRKTYPDLQLVFLPYRMDYDLDSPDVDAAIRFGTGLWPDIRSDYITGRELVPVCAPDLFTTRPESPADLLSKPLLHHTTASHLWASWFKDAGCEAPGSRNGAHYEQYFLLSQAAIAGIGVALIPRCLVEDELTEGKLVLALDRPFKAQEGYHLCYPEHKTNLPALQVFREWLLEISKDAEVPPAAQESLV